MNKVTDLSKVEYEVMDILWEAESDLLLLEILSRIDEKYHRGWKRQTLCTYLSHLVEKGVVESYRQGRYFYYRAIKEKCTYRDLETRYFLDYWFHNSVSDLIITLKELGIIDENVSVEIYK